jgi:hypothetical protein
MKQSPPELSHTLKQDSQRAPDTNGSDVRHCCLAWSASSGHAATGGPHHNRTKDSARVTADALGRVEEAMALRDKYGIERVAK